MDSARFLNGMPNPEPIQVMLTFFKKHSPGDDTLDHVEAVLADYKARADGADWACKRERELSM